MIGQTIGNYRVTARLGAGGMDEVFRATDIRLGREVALKFSAEQFSERFEREARAVAALNHPNICTLHDVAPNYLVMELVEGMTLAERIVEGPLPLDEAAEGDRAKRVGEQFGAVSPGVVQYTTDALFRDLWLRPDLTPRDRSLVTGSALIASGQMAQIPYHLNRALDSGLTRAQASEVLTHLAFDAGWPNVFSALPVAKDVFEKRPK